jgi:hypothetical protein
MRIGKIKRTGGCSTRFFPAIKKSRGKKTAAQGVEKEFSTPCE